MSVAVVTGGSTGIGAAICARLLTAGYHVVSVARRPPRDARCEHVEADLLDPAATREAAAAIAQRHAVSVVVHNAGAIRASALEQVRIEDVAALAQLHLSAAVLLVQAALPAMRAAGGGRVVLISSRAALGLATRTAYAATKAGMIGMARVWALELAPHGITVNVVAPGPIRATEMFHAVVPAESAREAALAASIPLRRLGRPEDVANAVMFFAGAESGFVTGQTLFVCGGTSVGSLSL
jgi:NAD(P)-dependent dehydrogenase (short-subunit alcohol dehydrogenase family)